MLIIFLEWHDPKFLHITYILSFLHITILWQQCKMWLKFNSHHDMKSESTLSRVVRSINVSNTDQFLQTFYSNLSKQRWIRSEELRKKLMMKLVIKKLQVTTCVWKSDAVNNKPSVLLTPALSLTSTEQRSVQTVQRHLEKNKGRTFHFSLNCIHWIDYLVESIRCTNISNINPVQITHSLSWYSYRVVWIVNRPDKVTCVLDTVMVNEQTLALYF